MTLHLHSIRRVRPWVPSTFPLVQVVGAACVGLGLAAVAGIWGWLHGGWLP